MSLPACSRCQGLRVEERIHGEGSRYLTQYRCLNCGSIEEPGLVRNYRLYNGYDAYSQDKQGIAE